jgi:hypothetical protein
LLPRKGACDKFHKLGNPSAERVSEAPANPVSEH